MDEAIRTALTAYTRELFAPEDSVLRAIHRAGLEGGVPHIHIQPEEGRMVQFLLTAAGVRRVVEIGTLIGYSGIWIARALPEDGLLISLEHNPEYAEMARTFFEQAGLGDRVRVHTGPALETLNTLVQEGPFDAIFLDADRPHYPAYLDWAMEHIRIGGLIMAHNAFLRGRIVAPRQRGEADVQAVDTFIRRIAADPRLLGTIIPVGDGIIAAVRIR